jgi:predicted nucleic acid-binding protein
VSPAIVVDASVALKWVVTEPQSDLADGLVERFDLLAPELLTLECCNALWARVRRREMTGMEARVSLEKLSAVPLALTADHMLAPAAMSLAIDLDHPAYDCAYLALAIDRAALVVTADRRFALSVRRHPFLADRIRLLEELAA